MSRTRCIGAALAVLSLLCWPGGAHAHLMSTGVGPFYDGALHVLASADQVLPLLALGLLAGLRGKASGRAILFGLPPALLAGAAVGRWGPPLPFIGAASTVLLLGLGGLVAADARVPCRVVILMAAGCGLVIGDANGAAMAEARLGAVSLFGIVAAGFVAAALVPAFVVSLRQAWMRIAVRVAGSWIAALGVLMAAWSV
jgi:urease accessory protein